MTGLKPSETAARLGGRAAGMKLKEIKVIGTLSGNCTEICRMPDFPFEMLCTETCKIIPAIYKFRELSLNFPKLADWLCMGWLSCLAAWGQEYFFYTIYASQISMSP